MNGLRKRGVSESDHEYVDNHKHFNFFDATYHDENSRQLNNLVHFEVIKMTCRDRTKEFMSAVKSLQGRATNGLVSLRETKTVKRLRQYSKFMEIAKLIGCDISNTYVKLEKLTLLAKRKSLFDDKQKEIQELTFIIKQDLNNLNQQIAKLQDLYRPTSERQHRHIHTHSNSVLVSLQTKLASMSNDFKHVLEVRTEVLCNILDKFNCKCTKNLKHQKNRQDHFTQGRISSNLPPSALAGYHSGSVLLADDQHAGNSDVSINIDNQYQKQLQLEEQEVDLQTRMETVQNIESTIVELGGIFQQLAFMVKEQEEMVYRIDHNIDDTSMNIEAAHAEILKYFRSITNNRWLMVKIFAVLIFFFIIFVVFLA